MKTKHLLQTAAFAVVSAFSLQPSALVFASPLGTAFNYQGQLAEGGNAANGSYDLKFTLYDADTGPGLVAGPITNAAVAVSNGLFTVALDFGPAAFNGEARWLEMGVRSNASPGDFTLLAPRQEVNPTPYARYAPKAGEAALAIAVPAHAITEDKIAPEAVKSTHLAPGAVTSAGIADGTITDADISSSGISGSKIMGGDLQALRLKVGEGHTLNGNVSSIAGGRNNVIGTDAHAAVVARGDGNTIGPNSANSSIAGGVYNQIGTNAFQSFIGGGHINSIGRGGRNSNPSALGCAPGQTPKGHYTVGCRF